MATSTLEKERREQQNGARRPASDVKPGDAARKPSIERLVGDYERLSPEDRARVRRLILRRAGEEEAVARAVKPAESVDIAAPKSTDDFELPSEQFFAFLRNVWKAVEKYVPYDSYRDGDEDRLDLVREEVLHALEPLEWVLKTYFRYEVNGLEHIPRKGRAIIVSNHGLLPVDGWFLFYEIWRHRGRWGRGLTDWRIYRLPWLRQLFMDMGMVVGSHENGDRLLQDENLIFIMPGGSKEAWKSSKYRYRLLWRGRTGFVRLALRNRAPIIPSANVGTDDTYRVFFDGYTTAYQLFRTKKVLLPISVPVGLGLFPLPVKMTQYVGEPIHLPYPPEAENDPAIVEECQEIVKAKVYELIDIGLRERQERSLGHIVRGR
ncbi:acyltransferase family protein [bacterium]|nr:acyltransferase family protein [bacterium]